MENEMEQVLRGVARFRVLSNRLRTNLHDSRICYPQNFNLDAVDDLLRQWDESCGEIVKLEAALAAEPPEQAAVTTIPSTASTSNGPSYDPWAQ